MNMNYGVSLYSINVIRFHQLTTSKGMTILAHSVNNTNYLFQITCSWNIINLLSLRTILFYLSVCLYTYVWVWVWICVYVCESRAWEHTAIRCERERVASVQMNEKGLGFGL